MNRRRGFTIIEMLIGALMMGVALSGTLFLSAAAFRSQSFTLARSDANTTVSQAVELLVRDLEPAKDVVVVASRHIRVRYAVLQSNGTYDRSRFDDSAEVEYFLGDGSGKHSDGGDVLWRKRSGALTAVARGVSVVQFSAPEPGVIHFSLSAIGKRGNVTTVEDRSVYLRNF